jgi:hypothetical protein
MPLILSGSAGLSGNVGTTTKEMLPAGSVLQVVQAMKSDTWVNASGDNYVEIPGLVASITPLNTSSKILVMISLGAVSSYSAAIRLLKNGSVLSGALGVTAGSRPAQTARASFLDANHPNDLHFTYMDSPNTAIAVNYSIGASGYASYPFYLNRSQNDIDTSNTYGGRTLSTITLMEIKA